jgi:hypothetical protein
VNCAGTKFAADYDDNAYDFLLTPEIDFTGKTTAALVFKAQWDMETYSGGSTTYAADGVRLIATPDQGNTWYLVTTTPGYNFNECDAFMDPSGNSTPAFGGTQAAWQEYMVDLSQAIGVEPKWHFAWEFASDYSIGKAGFFIDEIKVIAR